jgi:N-acetylglucosamine malate deacetylase 2
MKKIIFGIFAHPDDEAFGPAGALLKAVKDGAELHLITLTAGQAGTNSEHHADLGEVRLKEWHAAGKLIGATKMRHLGFMDGTLSNQTMLDAQTTIKDLVQNVIAVHNDTPIEIEFVTMDLNGLTGHIDHIVAARAASFAFYSLKSDDQPVTKIRYTCTTDVRHPRINTEWLFMEQGRSTTEINETIDASEYLDEIKQIMSCHYTQRHDAKNHLDALGDKVAVSHFIVRE